MFSRLSIFSFSVVGLFWGCTSPGAEGKGRRREGEVVVLSEAQRRGSGIRVEVLRPQALRIEKRLWGRTVVLAHSQASLHVPMEGIIREILIREGQWVPQGSVCFWVYAPGALELQKQYAEAYHQRQALMTRLIQQESLASQKLLSLSEVEQIRRALQAQERQLYSLEGQLQYIGLMPDTLGRVRLLPVKAPLSGYVSRVSVVTGQYVRMETELARLVNSSDLHADFYLTEGDLSWIQVGMPLVVHFPALPQLGPVPTRIEYVAQVEDSSGTHLIAHAALRELAVAVPAGVPVEGRTHITQDSVYAVPQAAVAFHGREAYIFVSEGDTLFRPLPVSTSFMDTLAILTGGPIQAGLPVVVKGAPFLAAQLWMVGEE